MTVTYSEYAKELTEFAKKHRCYDAHCYTSPMDNNRYHKERCWADGANWYEVTELVTETKEVEAHGLKFEVEVEFWRTEYWSTESGSKFFYEKA